MSATVISLDAWRKAKHAASVLSDLLQNPDWLRTIRVVHQRGDICILVRVVSVTSAAKICTPARVNDVPVTMVSDTKERENGDAR